MFSNSYNPPANRTRIFFFIASLVGTIALGGQILGQTPAPTPPESDVVRITSKIVQVDLLVVDKDGKQVQDLSASDFEIFQDSKPQKIAGFSYVKRAVAVQEEQKNITAVPAPVKVTPANAGRIITFIVDDGNCAFSLTSAIASRDGIEKFLREQMLPNDLVAIYQTRSGSSVFQQYTSDRTQLLKAAHKIRWYPAAGTCSSNDGSFFAAARSNTYEKQSVLGTTTNTVESGQDRKTREHYEDQISNNQIVGSLGLIRYVVKGLQRIPGRKVVFFMSDGLPLRSRDGEFLSAVDVLRDLTDLSNRASVVFNTIDSRGLFDAGMIEAADEVYVQNDAAASDKISSQRVRDSASAQEGLNFLARETGGKFYQGQNYLDAPIKKALSLETGYYLIAYEPSDETFKGKKFNKIRVKVKRPDLKVISRTGFVGIVTEIENPKRRSENSELYEAIVSPLPIPGFSIDLTAYFGNSPETGNFVRSFFHLGGEDIKFVDEPSGTKKAVFDVVAVTLNEKNAVIDEFTRTHTIRLDPTSVTMVRQNGLVYSADVPVKMPGTYNFRVAVRDSSGMLGSAGQIVEVPDLKNSSLFLSGLTVAQTDAQGKFELPGASSAQSAFSFPRTTAVYAIRGFQRGTILAYAYTIYNARLDKASGRPQMTIQVNLYKDGKLVLEGAPQPADFQQQNDWSRIQDFGYLRIKPEMEPGNYTMQVVAKDTLTGGKNATSSQWVDFTVLD